jgi:hypothetical protein
MKKINLALSMQEKTALQRMIAYLNTERHLVFYFLYYIVFERRFAMSLQEMQRQLICIP